MPHSGSIIRATILECSLILKLSITLGLAIAYCVNALEKLSSSHSDNY